MRLCYNKLRYINNKINPVLIDQIKLSEEENAFMSQREELIKLMNGLSCKIEINTFDLIENNVSIMNNIKIPKRKKILEGTRIDSGSLLENNILLIENINDEYFDEFFKEEEYYLIKKELDAKEN